MAKKTQKKGKCIFCGGFGLTKQHVFPDWLREYFPRSEKDTNTQKLMYMERMGEDSMIATPKNKKSPGHLGTKKIRNVCEACNSGWMSRLEKEVKPIVVELLKGHAVALDKKKQELLSRWIMLVNIMIEYTDVKTMAIPQSDRTLIKEGILPAGWKIWIGYSDNKNWEFRFLHNGGKMMLKSDYEKGCPEPQMCNVQVTTIGIGKLYIHAVRNCLEFYEPIMDKYEIMGLMQIYPYVKDIPITMIPKYINDVDSDIIPDFLFDNLAKKDRMRIKTIFVDTENLVTPQFRSLHE